MKTLKEAYNELIESNLNEPEERKAYLQDLVQYGGASGMLSGLIYYGDTEEFFDKYHEEITTMLQDLKEETGLDEKELFGRNWDAVHGLLSQQNRCVLCWFAIEQLAINELEGAE